MLNRRVTRVVLDTTEVTDLLAHANGADYVPVFTTAKALYVGFHGKFASRYFQVGSVPNAATSALTVEYWDGAAWSAVDDLLDQTSVGGKTFARSGFISWVNKENWAASSLPNIDDDVELYWVKITVSADLDAGLALSSILNLFCDDALLRAYFPELLTDTNYLPTGKSNFLDQYIEAKNLVVLRLKQRKIINQESQVIDINDVSVAATYGAAMIILQAIATSEDTEKLLAIARKGFDYELNEVDIAVDQNEDGVIDDSERQQFESILVVRR